MSYTTAEKLVEIKIERNNEQRKIIELENEILKREMKIRYRIIECNIKKIDIIKQINAIEELQKIEYSLEREAKVTALTNEVNTLNVDINDLLEKNINDVEERKKAIRKALLLNSSIPEKTIVTNFKMR